MKNTFYLFVAALTLSMPSQVRAQVQAVPEASLEKEHITDPYAQRGDAWWSALGQQLTQQLDVPLERVQAVTLQNIIYFATNYPDRARFNGAVPQLLEIYRHHEDDAFRIMGAAALHAIGDRYGMQAFSKAVAEEKPGLVRRIGIAALVDYYDLKK